MKTYRLLAGQTPLRRLTTLTAICSLLLATAAFVPQCNQSEKDRNIAFAKDVSGAFRTAADIVAKDHPDAAAKMRQGADLSDKLILALQGTDANSIAAIVRDILPIFTDVAKEFSNNRNVLLALALGQIGLNFFVNHYLQSTGPNSAMPGDASGTLEQFMSLPQFGCQLKPEKCK